MRIPRFVLWMFSVSMMILGAGAVSGQDYPSKPIRIVTADPGSTNDLVARLIAQGLTGSLGQQVVVENRGGASGIIAAQTVTKAPPDGYTLLLYSNTLWIGPLLQKLPHSVRDFSPITLLVSSPQILAVHPSLPVHSVKELIALAKVRPGELNYASTSTGSSPHLAAELFKAMAGVNMVRVNYKGGGSALNALLGGQVQLYFATAALVTPHIKSGRLRALAVSSAEPSALAPGLSTLAGSGLPGYETVAMYGMFAPAGTPATVIDRLHQEVVRVLNRTEVKEKFFNVGMETVGSSPEEFAATMKSDMARMSKVIKDAAIRVE